MGIEAEHAGRSRADRELIARISRPPAQRPPARSGADAVDAAELKAQLGLESEYLAGRLLAQLDDDGDGTVERGELLQKLEALMDGPPSAKLRFAFGVHDHDDNGVIDRGELLRMLHISLAENRLAFGDDTVEALADSLFSRADADGDGGIDFDEFRAALEHYPGVLEHMTLGDLRWLGLGAPPVASRPPSAIWMRWRARLQNLPWLALVAVFLSANLLLFGEAFLRYREAGASLYVQLARGCGACLNLAGALVLVPMCRRLLTWVGRSAVGRVLIDDHVAFHRMVGNAAFALGLGHTTAHLLNFASGPTGLRGLLAWAGVTGVLLLLVHAILFVFSRDGIRRTRRFELFHLTHRLYPVWVLLMLLHGPRAWMWMSVPVLLFVVDRFFLRRVQRTRARELAPLSSGVTRVAIDRPSGFDAQPGDYAFVCVPAIAASEWHPFTISSAPERGAPEGAAPSDEPAAGELTLHVRTAGNWTSALRELAEDRPPDAPPLPCWLDGPYGTPTAHIFDSRFAVLVGAGIGVTPFASVLESLLLRKRRGDAITLEQVVFVWVCREQRAFEWFADLLGELEREAPELFDVRIFMDAGRTDMKSTLLRVAMDGLYARTDQDLVTGLRARTTLGPPDWDGLLGRAATAHAPDRVDCFYCGPPGLAGAVKAACDKHGLPFRQEHF